MELKRILLIFCVVFFGISLEVKSIRFCLSCDATTTRTVCDSKTKKCSTPRCSELKMEKCQKRSDICIASWTSTKKGIVTLAGCFPLPPHSNRGTFSKSCQPWNINGTYTCLCRRNGCNKYPLPRPIVSTTVPRATQTTTVELMTRQMTQSAAYTGQAEISVGATSYSLRWILIISASLLLVLFMLGSCYATRNLVKHTDASTKPPLITNHCLNKSGSTSIQNETKLHQLPELTSIISEGQLCSVWRGTYSGIDVAVKCLSKEIEQLWSNEYHIFSKCNINHKNIVTFIAASDLETNATELWLATKYCSQGTLKSYLETHKLSWGRLLTMAKDITAGLSFLHSDRLTLGGGSKSVIAHQDLKSNNVLIKGDGTCVIADFGLSIELTQEYSQQLYRNGQVGTIRYMAPEKLDARIDIENPESFKQIDVYSLALILWELLTRCQINREHSTCSDYSLPYQDLIGSHPTLSQMIGIVSVNGCRPNDPKVLIDKSMEDVQYLWATIKECWDQDPEARLTADCVLLRLETLNCKN